MSLAPLATLRVTSQTTLEDLQAFQTQIGKDDAKLRGTVNKDGTITLKAVDKGSSFLSHLTGKAKDQRNTARAALTQVMVQTGATNRKPAGSLTSLINADRSHSPRAVALKGLVAFAKSANGDGTQGASRTGVKLKTYAEDLSERQFASLDKKNLSTATFDQHMQLAASETDTGPLSNDKITQYANEIRTDLMQQLTANGPLSSNERTKLGVSDIRGFVDAALAQSVPAPVTQAVGQAMGQIAEAVTKQMTETLLGTKHTGNDSFQIGNEVFTRVENLGAGGFGTADLYRCDTTGREVVLKAPNLDGPNQRKEDIENNLFCFRSEIDMHSKLMDQGGVGPSGLAYPHLLQFEGAVLLPSGQFGTITEACTGGNMDEVMGKIDQAVTDGSLTRDQAMAAKLTLMRDMADGQSVVNGLGFSHRDVKFPNVFINSEGVAKVADFGESAFSSAFSLSNEKMIDNAVYLAPENMVAKTTIKSLPDDVKASKISHLKAKAEVYNGLVGKGGMLQHLGLETIGTDLNPKNTNSRMNAMEAQIESVPEHADLIKSIINDSTSALERQLQSALDNSKAALPARTMIDGAASDVWSFGASILIDALGHDKSINSQAFMSTAEKSLVAYFNAKPTPGVNGGQPTPLPEALVPGSFLNADFVTTHANGTVTGDADLDALVNATLKRDPNDRPSFADIVRNPIFNRDGVGDTETRALIAALGGKPAKTADQIKALAAQMNV